MASISFVQPRAAFSDQLFPRSVIIVLSFNLAYSLYAMRSVMAH